MAKKIKFTKNTFKKIGAVLLAGALGIGAIFGIAKLGEVLDTPTKTIHPIYSVGGISSTTGKGDSSIKSSVYTKDAFECQGLKITPNFDSNVSYEVFFYNSYEQFLYSSGSKTDFYESDNKLAKYARIVVTPNNDDKVSWFETAKYGAQLKVEVNKEQNVDILNHIDNYKIDVDFLGDVSINGEQGVFHEPGIGAYFFDFIDCTNKDNLIIKMKKE